MSFHPFGATIGNLAPPLTVANGGTGATAAQPARSSLGVSSLQPADIGLIAWAYDPTAAGGGSNSQTSGTVTAVRVLVPATTITNIVLGINSAGVSLTSGQNFAGLYNAAGTTLLSATADQATAWQSGFTTIVAPLTTPQAVSAGYVWVAWYVNNTAGSNPKWQWCGSANFLNLGQTGVNARFCTGGTGRTTSLPASLAFSATADGYWCGLS